MLLVRRGDDYGLSLAVLLGPRSGLPRAVPCPEFWTTVVCPVPSPWFCVTVAVDWVPSVVVVVVVVVVVPSLASGLLQVSPSRFHGQNSHKRKAPSGPLMRRSR